MRKRLQTITRLEMRHYDLTALSVSEDYEEKKCDSQFSFALGPFTYLNLTEFVLLKKSPDDFILKTAIE